MIFPPNDTGPKFTLNIVTPVSNRLVNIPEQGDGDLVVTNDITSNGPKFTSALLLLCLWTYGSFDSNHPLIAFIDGQNSSTDISKMRYYVSMSSPEGDMCFQARDNTGASVGTSLKLVRADGSLTAGFNNSFSVNGTTGQSTFKPIYGSNTRSITLPSSDPGADANFVLTEGSQTINDSKSITALTIQ